MGVEVVVTQQTVAGYDDVCDIIANSYILLPFCSHLISIQPYPAHVLRRMTVKQPNPPSSIICQLDAIHNASNYCLGSHETKGDDGRPMFPLLRAPDGAVSTHRKAVPYIP